MQELSEAESFGRSSTLWREKTISSFIYQHDIGCSPIRGVLFVIIKILLFSSRK